MTISQTLHYISSVSLAFPSVNNALSDPNGLLAIGGDLSCERLVSAYQQGIFPWFSEQDPIMWWSPDPRAIISIEDIRINRTLTKVLKKSDYRVSVNCNFDQVIDYCSDAPFRKEDTWIVPQMIDAYKQLHQQGFAHSIEVWMNNELVGGLYGVAINGYFSGESMFYTKNNASKIALVYLIRLLAQVNVDFIDCQILNPFLKDMGCKEISRNKFIELKNKAITNVVPSNLWQARNLKF
ncbi:MAG: leucyl/phenylalanyl-tRNA--protein transferase [Alteromonadaceae bacterium]|nr:leucyl/phenylalanyl-tRNA--protein transferase [Alteromonadaceae bacterium]